MKKSLIIGFVFSLLIVSCKKKVEPEGPVLPKGATVYTDTQVAFVPYAATDQLFKKASDFTEELSLIFKERKATKEFYAWDQTFFDLSTDFHLDIELRLRYLQTEEVSQKTLAIYMPYWDDAGVIRSTIFECPIETIDFETGFFKEIVTFHDTIDIFGTEWLDVYEINPLTSTDENMESESRFSKVFYTTSSGLIELDQKNGDKWVLFP